jgi:small subunit ribosomal protein S5
VVENKEEKTQEKKIVGESSPKESNFEDKRKVMIRRKQKRKRGNDEHREHEYDKRVVSIRRVARTYEGGKRMRLSVCMVIGDKKGMVGIGLGKGADVKIAGDKAYNEAKKNMFKIGLKGNTIPHEINHKKGAAKLFMKPAAPGTGVVAGGSLRLVLEVVGVKDVLTKILGTSNQIMNAYAAIEALRSLKTVKIAEEAQLN